ncbi:hypothetical protein [Micromonospora sp. NPDC047187]|uniref:hypothetical protein n=1 Tax=Micromonospora sp. NPDC047187 TaxID=3155262 RepID=UPI0033E8AB5B
MPEKVVTQKTLCYVLRDRRLVVFRHGNYSPGGWLVLADVTYTPPRVFWATEDDIRLIHTVMRRVYRTIAGLDGAGTWRARPTPLACFSARAWRRCASKRPPVLGPGAVPDASLLADVVGHLRPVLTTPKVTDADLDRFVTLMADPNVLLGSYERRAVDARKATA